MRCIGTGGCVMARGVRRRWIELVIARRPGRGTGGWLRSCCATSAGAEWILLAASLGCVSVAQGDNRLAEGLLNWIEGTATADGFLPEQVTDNVQSPHMLRYWQQRWGQTACPLLWSHAMHLILLDDLGRLSPCRATG
jgi:GH15 family glucan-1,4-alpha-glucosidase